MRTFSFGGGVQSMAVLVLAAAGRVQYDAFLFANVGDDSERAETLTYFQNVAKPYAAANGIELIELQKTKKNGEKETIYSRVMREGSKSLPLPVYMSTGAPGKRSCTADFKIGVISKWLKLHGATKSNPAVCGLGISVDEIHRAKSESGVAWQTLEYPLLDLRMFRRDCVKVIQDAGLPVPPKSACWFCPFHSKNEWQRMKREEPDVFDLAVNLELTINSRRNERGMNSVYFNRDLVPLSQAIGNQSVMDFGTEDAPCDTGYCFV